MEAEKIIEELNSTVVDIHKVVKHLIDTNEALEAENEELMQIVLKYEEQLYKIRKVMDRDLFNKEN